MESLFLYSFFILFIHIHSFLQPLQNTSCFLTIKLYYYYHSQTHSSLYWKTFPCLFVFFLIYRNPVHSLQVDKCFLCLNLTFFLSSLSNNYHTCCIIIELLTFMPFFSRLETLSSRTFTYSTLGYDVSPVLTLRR